MKGIAGLFLVAVTVCALAAPNGPQGLAAAAALEENAPLLSAVPFERLTSVESDSDRGCCLLRTDTIKCAYANRKYCRTKAEEADVTFEFYKDTACKNVSDCPTTP